MKFSLTNAVLLIVSAFLSACGAYSRPRTSVAVFDSHRAVSQRFTLGIDYGNANNDGKRRDNAFVTAEDLIAAARNHKVLKRVDYLDRFPTPPDLILREFSYREFMICEPLAPYVTFGVIPDDCRIHHPVAYTLNTRDGRTLLHVQKSRDDSLVIGWLALVLRLSPDWASEEDKQAHAESVVADLLQAIPRE